jgi:hypothetical protein
MEGWGITLQWREGLPKKKPVLGVMEDVDTVEIKIEAMIAKACSREDGGRIALAVMGQQRRVGTQRGS